MNKNSWITIYDNTFDSRTTYVSESVTDITGWEPEDIIGLGVYGLIHTGDHRSMRKVHSANVSDEKMSSMVSYRFKCKNGDYVHLETIVQYCHEVIICCNYLYNENSLDHKMRISTVDEVFNCLPDGSLRLAGAWNDHQQRVEETMSPWVDNRVQKPQERRFCMILNRFTDELNIVFVSELARDLVSLDVANSIGLSFYNFVQERDVGSLEKQIDLAKEHDMVVRLRFDWVIDREKGISEPVEAITSSTDDGLVMVCRVSPRLFVDK